MCERRLALKQKIWATLCKKTQQTNKKVRQENNTVSLPPTGLAQGNYVGLI